MSDDNQLPFLGDLRPVKIYEEYDGQPLCYLAMAPDGGRLLVSMVDELPDEELVRFTVTAVSRTTLEKLERGELDARSGILSGWLWLADRRYDGEWVVARMMDADELDDDLFPEEGVPLHTELELASPPQAPALQELLEDKAGLCAWGLRIEEVLLRKLLFERLTRETREVPAEAERLLRRLALVLTEDEADVGHETSSSARAGEKGG